MPEQLQDRGLLGRWFASAIRILKLASLVLVGPLYFIYIAILAPMWRSRSGFRGWYWRQVKRACSHLLWLLSVRTEISDSDRSEIGSDDNSLIVVNHRSHLDGFILMDTIPDEKWFSFGAKKELFKSVLLRRGFTGAGLVEIDRESGRIALKTMSQAVREMPRRRSLLLFPEGTRAKNNALGSFKPGAVLIARETGRSIRPIVIRGADRLLPRNKVVPVPGTVQVHVLPPFACDTSVPVEDDLRRLRGVMRDVFEAPATDL